MAAAVAGSRRAGRGDHDMKRRIDLLLLVATAIGPLGCYHDVSANLDSSDASPVVYLHVENQCITGAGGVTVCGPSTWGATAPACTNANAVCPCTSLYTTPLTFDPTDYPDFNDNISKLHDVTINSISLQPNPLTQNRATRLTSAQIIITDVTATPARTQTFTLTQPVLLTASNTYTTSVFTPDPSSFLKDILMNSHTMTVAVASTAAIDVCPVDIDLSVAFALTLSVKLF
jgi:hypothetical protein